MSTENPNTEDYVLVPRRKARIGGARRGIIGLMIIGSIAAVAGAGTFASFSATTTNDATFKTVRLALSDAVNGGTACVSPAGVAGNGTATADVDVNDASNCAALLSTPIAAGATQTASVVITNTGDTAGNVYLFAPSACTVAVNNTSFNIGSTASAPIGAGSLTNSLCQRILLTVEENGACVFPATDTGACDGLNDDTGTAYSFYHFGLDNPFATKLTAFTALAPSTPKTYTVKIYMKVTRGCTVSGDTDGNNDGFTNNQGYGCDNQYQNQKANLNMRWLMQA